MAIKGFDNIVIVDVGSIIFENCQQTVKFSNLVTNQKCRLWSLVWHKMWWHQLKGVCHSWEKSPRPQWAIDYRRARLNGWTCWIRRVGEGSRSHRRYTCTHTYILCTVKQIIVNERIGTNLWTHFPTFLRSDLPRDQMVHGFLKGFC
jgi:hypothetical protein